MNTQHKCILNRQCTMSTEHCTFWKAWMRQLELWQSKHKICSFVKLSKQRRHWGRWWQWWWKNWHSWNYHWSGISHPGLRHFPIWRHLCALCLKKFSPLNHIKTATLKHHGTDFCFCQKDTAPVITPIEKILLPLWWSWIKSCHWPPANQEPVTER